MFGRRKPLLWVNNSIGYKGVALLTVVCFSFILSIFIAAERNLGETVVSIAEARIKQIAVEAINQLIKEEIAQKIDYQDLMVTHKDKQGHLVMFQPNLSKIDSLQLDTALAVNKRFKNLNNEEISIPLGQILGSKLFASLGPSIDVGIVPIGTVDVKVVNGFEEAGINQTRHTIALKVTGSMKIVVPLVSSYTKVETEVLVADNIFFGQVPNVYLNSTESSPNSKG